MRKHIALVTVATAVFSIPTATSFAAPSPQGDGVLPKQACHAAIPAHLQPTTCGRGADGPGSVWSRRFGIRSSPCDAQLEERSGDESEPQRCGSCRLADTHVDIETPGRRPTFLA